MSVGAEEANAESLLARRADGLLAGLAFVGTPVAIGLLVFAPGGALALYLLAIGSLAVGGLIGSMAGKWLGHRYVDGYWLGVGGRAVCSLLALPASALCWSVARLAARPAVTGPLGVQGVAFSALPVVAILGAVSSLFWWDHFRGPKGEDGEERQFARKGQLRRWLFSSVAPIVPGRAIRLRAQYFMTGPDLIDRIVRAIQLNQSVVLAGPRGSGKSFCVEEGLKEAASRGFIVAGASVFLQGNREIPRDYLIEDEIAFKSTPDGAGHRVVPYRRSSPLFRFARRRDDSQEPIEGKDGVVECVIDPTDKASTAISRFVLFLDEINRFSDGVLDSLLSILEERKAVLAGETYKLPVVVCMTMNPPGYDATARKLSPPLAARIGRSYRLCSPDLDTLADTIVGAKMERNRREYDSPVAVVAAAIPSSRPAFPARDTAIERKAALVTLCLWGDITRGKAGVEYLTPETFDLLKRVMKEDPIVRDRMKRLVDLCQYGPDGRAAADWLTAATGLAIEEATRSGALTAVLTSSHMIQTVVESVAHKIYDTFSQGTHPELIAEKEEAVETICRQVFTNDRVFTPIIRRIVDQGAPFTEPFKPPVSTLNPAALRQAFIEAQAVRDQDVKLWKAIATEIGQPGWDPITDDNKFLGLLVEKKLVLPAESAPGGAGHPVKAGFIAAKHTRLAERLAKDDQGRIGLLLKGLLKDTIGPTRPPIWDDMAKFEAIAIVGVATLQNACAVHGVPSTEHEVNALVALLQNIHTTAKTKGTTEGGGDNASDRGEVMQDQVEAIFRERLDPSREYPDVHPPSLPTLEALRELINNLRGKHEQVPEDRVRDYEAFLGLVWGRLRGVIKRRKKPNQS